MKETQTNELPRVWKDVKWIMANMKTCRESGDAEGVGKWADKLAKWRDAHPEEVLAIVGELMR